jgi:NaMN:DMB phosphoribosyltransferase
MNNDLIRVYTQVSQAEAWLRKYQGKNPVFACVFGFTETALIPGISAAGSTPEARKYTACADAEFLYFGVEHEFKYSLPPLTAGASPVFISRAIIEALNIPMYLFDAGSYEEAGSREQGAGSREQGAGSREQGAGGRGV